MVEKMQPPKFQQIHQHINVVPTSSPVCIAEPKRPVALGPSEQGLGEERGTCLCGWCLGVTRKHQGESVACRLLTLCRLYMCK